MIFRESSKGTVKSINITKSSIEKSTIYQYITLPVSGNYTVTAHDIVDGIIITNSSVVYPQLLEYIFNYTVSNISPQLNYIFIADILDYFNNSKTKNESSFSEYSIFD